jgi:predicted glycosyltransferase
MVEVLLDAGHPAHLLMFAEALTEVEAKGHSTMVTTRSKDRGDAMALELGLRSRVAGLAPAGKSTSVYGEWVGRVRAFDRLVRTEKPRLLLGHYNPAVGYASFRRRVPSLQWHDDEAWLQPGWIHASVGRMSSTIVVPEAMEHSHGRKELRVKSYKELGYLHPARFTPDPAVLQRYGLSASEPYALLRFVGWAAHHDDRSWAPSDARRQAFVDLIRSHGLRVLVSQEGKAALPKGSEAIQPKGRDFHHILAQATLYAGDSQTTAAEAAVLGVPAVRYNHWTRTRDWCNYLELDRRFGLLRNVRSEEELQSVVAACLEPSYRAECQRRRAEMLRQKEDMTALWTRLILERLP